MPDAARPDIEGLLRLAEVATPGPWIAYPDAQGVEGSGHVRFLDDELGELDVVLDCFWNREDTPFIAASRDGIPALANYALSLEAELSRYDVAWRAVDRTLEAASGAPLDEEVSVVEHISMLGRRLKQAESEAERLTAALKAIVKNTSPGIGAQSSATEAIYHQRESARRRNTALAALEGRDA